MKETALSNCERDFILLAASEGKRLDGRGPYDYRNVKIAFGIDRGCCHVEVGDTRVLAQVSCEVGEPKAVRPTEGLLFVNVELSPMASPGFEVGRMSEYGVEINRILERCFKESKCVDLESLCIVAHEKVWHLRLDVHVINHAGNIIDCASIAGISALAHFRRPDVTVSGEDVTIHTAFERDPIPLSVHHMPICITFAFFNQGLNLFVGPSEKEERVMNGKMVVGMNKHRELCTLQMTGDMLLLKDQVVRCSNIAVVKVMELTELIHKALENDSQARKDGKKFGFATLVEESKITSSIKDSEDIDMSDIDEKLSEIIEKGDSDINSDTEPKQSVKILAPGTGEIGGGGEDTWCVDKAEIENKKVKNNRSKKVICQTEHSGHISDDSEEEETVMLGEL